MQCASGCMDGFEHMGLLFRSGEQLKGSCRTMGGHYCLINTWGETDEGGGK